MSGVPRLELLLCHHEAHDSPPCQSHDLTHVLSAYAAILVFAQND